jgi:hypothetical protein
MNEQERRDTDAGADRAAAAIAERDARENASRADDEADGLTTADLLRANASDRDRDPDVQSVGDAETAGEAASDETPTPLFAEDEGGQYRDRWRTIQTQFVDDPRRSVEEADQLVARLMQDLAKTFADERAGLERQWGSGQDVSTEDLRLALQRYRSFFDRLLSI